MRQVSWTIPFFCFCLISGWVPGYCRLLWTGVANNKKDSRWRRSWLSQACNEEIYHWRLTLFSVSALPYTHGLDMYYIYILNHILMYLLLPFPFSLYHAVAHFLNDNCAYIGPHRTVLHTIFGIRLVWRFIMFKKMIFIWRVLSIHYFLNILNKIQSTYLSHKEQPVHKLSFTK